MGFYDVLGEYCRISFVVNRRLWYSTVCSNKHSLYNGWKKTLLWLFWLWDNWLGNSKLKTNFWVLVRIPAPNHDDPTPYCPPIVCSSSVYLMTHALRGAMSQAVVQTDGQLAAGQSLTADPLIRLMTEVTQTGALYLCAFITHNSLGAHITSCLCFLICMCDLAMTVWQTGWWMWVSVLICALGRGQ